jgi:hypothetical protein
MIFFGACTNEEKQGKDEKKILMGQRVLDSGKWIYAP